MSLDNLHSARRSEGLASRLANTWGASLMERPRQPGIGIVKTADDLEEVARLRYELYIQRDQKPYAAEHDLRLFCDDADPSSLIFYARSGGELGASVRLTRAADAFRDVQLTRLVDAANLSATEVDTTVINSRFVMKPNWRMRALAYPLFQEVYVTGLLAGAQRALLTTRPNLVGIFERFGFRTMGPEIEDEIAGRLVLMELWPHDVPHLKAIRSVLLDAPGLQAASNIPHGALL
jgi:predicted GNAT family N-acyltransferase